MTIEGPGSKRVDDVDKAQVMAKAEDQHRENAMILDRSVNAPIETNVNTKSVKLEGSYDNYVGATYKGFDKNMSDEQIRESIAESANKQRIAADVAGEVAGKKYEEQIKEEIRQTEIADARAKVEEAFNKGK